MCLHGVLALSYQFVPKSYMVSIFVPMLQCGEVCVSILVPILQCGEVCSLHADRSLSSSEIYLRQDMNTKYDN